MRKGSLTSIVCEASPLAVFDLGKTGTLRLAKRSGPIEAESVIEEHA
jgi:hypothetical protein